MYLPESIHSLAVTSTAVWYLYASLTGNQPSNQWTTKTGVYSDAHCRNLCSTFSTCSEYFYTNTIGSVCLVSINSNAFDQAGPSVGEFSFARKLELDLVTFANYNYTDILSNSGLEGNSNFYTCYSIVDNSGVETFTTCAAPKASNLARASDGSLCLNPAYTFSCDSSYTSVSCLPGSGLNITAAGSSECVLCGVESSPGGTTFCATPIASVTFPDSIVIDSFNVLNTTIKRANKVKLKSPLSINGVHNPPCPIGWGATGDLDSYCNVCPSDSTPATPYEPCICSKAALCSYIAGTSSATLDIGCLAGNYQTASQTPFTCVACQPGFYKIAVSVVQGVGIVDTNPSCSTSCSSLVPNAVLCDATSGQVKQCPYGYNIPKKSNRCRKCFFPSLCPNGT